MEKKKVQVLEPIFDVDTKTYQKETLDPGIYEIIKIYTPVKDLPPIVNIALPGYRRSTELPMHIFKAEWNEPAKARFTGGKGKSKSKSKSKKVRRNKKSKKTRRNKKSKQ